MFGAIIILHKGEHSFPAYYEMRKDGSILNIHFTEERPLLPIEPMIYSVVIQKTPLFSRKPLGVAPDGSAIHFDAYVTHLSNFLDEFLETERALATNSMDLLRYYFIRNDLMSATALLTQVPAHGDYAMLRFLIKHKCYEQSLSAKYSLHIQDGGTQSSGMPSYLGLEDLREAIAILRSIDSTTNAIFILEILAQVPPLHLNEIWNNMQTSDEHIRCYLALKMAEVLFAAELYRIGALMLFTAAMDIGMGQDISLKNELIRIATETVKSGHWLSLVRQIVEDIRAEEICKYGIALTNGVGIIGNDCTVETIKVRSYNEIFEFSLFKRTLNNVCTDKIVITKDGETVLDGIKVAGGRFIPVFASGTELKIPVAEILGSDKAVHEKAANSFTIESALLANGAVVPINRTFEWIQRLADITLVSVERASTGSVCTFRITGTVKSIMLDSAYGSYVCKEDCLIVSLTEGVVYFSVRLEIAEGIFEEKKYYL